MIHLNSLAVPNLRPTYIHTRVKKQNTAPEVNIKLRGNDAAITIIYEVDPTTGSSRLSSK